MFLGSQASDTNPFLLLLPKECKLFSDMQLVANLTTSLFILLSKRNQSGQVGSYMNSPVWACMG